MIDRSIAAVGGIASGFPCGFHRRRTCTRSANRLFTRLKSRLLGGSNEASLTRKLAGTIFVIRVLSAGLAYLSQILLARWMGGSDYGVDVYVWTWVLLLGSMMDFGIEASAEKIIPEYRTRGEHALLRGFLSGSRWMTFEVSAAVSLAPQACQAAIAIHRGRRRRPALHRLRHAAAVRRRQHPGRHCALR